MARLVNAPFLRAGPLLLDHLAPAPRTAPSGDAGADGRRVADEGKASRTRTPLPPRARPPASRRARMRKKAPT